MPRAPYAIWARWPNASLRRLSSPRAGAVHRRRGLPVEWKTQIVVLALAPTIIALGGSLFGPPLWAPTRSQVEALWGVQASLLGFAVALTLFGLERVSELRMGSAASVAGSRLAVSIRSGFVVLGLTSFAVLIPRLAPLDSWIRMEAAVVAGAWLVITAWGVGLALAATNSSFAINLLSPELWRSVRVTARQEMTERRSMALLRDHVSAAGGEFQPWLWIDEGLAEANLVRTVGSGTVYDVNIPRLRASIQACISAGAKPTVGVRLGAKLGNAAVIASAQAAIPQEARRGFAEALILRDTSDFTSDFIEQLHRIASASVKANDGRLDAVLDAYDTALSSYSSEWTAEVGVLLPEHIDSMFTFDRGPSAGIRRSVAKLLREAVQSGSVEDLDALAYFPLRAAQRAIAERSRAYFEFLDLFPFMYRLAGPDPLQSDNHRFLRDRSWRFLREALTLILPAIRKAGDPSVDPTMVDSATLAVRRNLYAVAREAIRTADFNTFSRATRYLRQSSE